MAKKGGGNFFRQGDEVCFYHQVFLRYQILVSREQYKKLDVFLQSAMEAAGLEQYIADIEYSYHKEIDGTLQQKQTCWV
ncbi:MAG: hypothetical protein KBF25_03670 [Chitinophagaceae bacterium]|nr:hypothetical protein [Chitinophagaceae bacterium]